MQSNEIFGPNVLPMVFELIPNKEPSLISYELYQKLIKVFELGGIKNISPIICLEILDQMNLLKLEEISVADHKYTYKVGNLYNGK